MNNENDCTRSLSTSRVIDVVWDICSLTIWDCSIRLTPYCKPSSKIIEPKILERAHRMITRKQSTGVMAQFKVAMLAGSLNVIAFDPI